LAFAPLPGRGDGAERQGFDADRDVARGDLRREFCVRRAAVLDRLVEDREAAQVEAGNKKSLVDQRPGGSPIKDG